MHLQSVLVFLSLHSLLLIEIVPASHYQGGTISWRPVDPYVNSSAVTVIFHQKHSWLLSRYRCNDTTIANLWPYTDGGGGFTGEPSIQCLSSAASCSGTGFTTISQMTYCTDFSVVAQSSSGALLKRMILNRMSNIVVGFYSSAWPTQIRTNTSTAASIYRVVTRLDLTQKYPINSSPIIASIPIIRVIEGQTAVIHFPVIDWDQSDMIRCRWASSAGPAGNECGDVCSNLPGAVIVADNCTMIWPVVRRPVDIAANVMTSTYVAALMVEDFVSFSSTTPMSSVPLQVLIYTYRPAAGSCSVLPQIIGDRPDRACIPALINVTLTERIVATVNCPGDYITQFITSAPLFLRKTSVAYLNGSANLQYITITWKPTDDQKGPQIFCAAPVDQRGLTGLQFCLNFIVGYSGPNLIRPTTVQGSASPIGTVFSNHSFFIIQATLPVYRPNRNGTYIQIFEQTNPSTPVWQIDCGFSPFCIYSGSHLMFVVQNAAWTPGARYFILFSSGVVSDYMFCSLESTPINDPTFWTFDIWNPSFSSTMTTITTPPPPVTITTRALLTTTVNGAFTTTGIVMIPASTTLTTTTTTTTTSDTTMITADRTPKEPENQWLQPMIIGIVLGALTVLLCILLCLYAYCHQQKKRSRLKIQSIFIPQHSSSNQVVPIVEDVSTDIPEDEPTNPLPPIAEEEMETNSHCP